MRGHTLSSDDEPPPLGGALGGDNVTASSDGTTHVTCGVTADSADDVLEERGGWRLRAESPPVAALGFATALIDTLPGYDATSAARRW